MTVSVTRGCTGTTECHLLKTEWSRSPPRPQIHSTHDRNREKVFFLSCQLTIMEGVSLFITTTDIPQGQDKFLNQERKHYAADYTKYSRKCKRDVIILHFRFPKGVVM